MWYAGPQIVDRPGLLMNPKTLQDNQSSHLFTVRVWREPLGQGHSEWRGQVRHVLSGEVRYFREWAQLVAYLEGRAGTPGAESGD